MSIDVERHIHFLSHLHIETLQTVGTEHFKHHLSRIGIMCLDNIALNFPFTTR